jgi:ferritin-like metal-binding protein YciE
MKLDTLEQLLIDQLKDLYSAENQLIKALPKMAKAANDAKLRQGFEKHHVQTQKQAERLEQIFEEMEIRGKGKKCAGMEGLIEEGQELLEEGEDADPNVLDAGIIAAAQRIEHYEIAGYTSARNMANVLGMTKPARLLQQTLDEEIETDRKLNELAEGSIHQLAMEGGEEGEEEEVEEEDEE